MCCGRYKARDGYEVGCLGRDVERVVLGGARLKKFCGCAELASCRYLYTENAGSRKCRHHLGVPFGW